MCGSRQQRAVAYSLPVLFIMTLNNGSHAKGARFEEILCDKMTSAREGRLVVRGREIQTPILWLGHSFKDSIALGSGKRHGPQALLVNTYEVLRRKRVLAAVRLQGIHKHLGYTGPVMMDSGGFLFQNRRDLKVCPVEVADLYEEAEAEIGVALDHPLMPTAHSATNSRRWKLSLRNLHVMMYKVSSCAFMPVVHGYTLRALQMACGHVRAIFGEPLLIGIGSLVPLLKASHLGASFRYRRSDGTEGNHRSFISDAIKLVRDEFPSSFLHVFGVGGINNVLSIFSLGADSVDSVAWRLKAAYGAIQLPGMGDRYLSPRPHSQKTRRVLQKDEESVLRQCGCPVCLKHESANGQRQELDSSFRARCLHNIWVVNNQVRAFRKSLRARRVHEFIAQHVAVGRHFPGNFSPTA